MIQGAALFLLAFEWFLIHVVPGCYHGDCGEILAAVFAGGVPHPTGFPAYLLGATPLAVWGRTPFWVHVLSAGAAALSVVLVGAVFLRMTADRFSALAASLLLAASAPLLVHAATARVYTLNLVLFAAFLLLGVRAEPNRSRAMTLGLVAGLGFGTHIVFIAAPVFFAALNWRRRREWAHLLPWGMAGIILSLSLHLWIPLRANLDPAVNWTDPSRWGSALDYFTQRHYRLKMFARGFDGTLLFLREVGGAFGRGWSLAYWILAAAGCFFAWKGHRPLFRAGMAAVLVNLFIMGAYGIEKDLVIAYRYFLPTYAVASLWGALAVRELLSGVGNRRWAGVIVAVLLALGVVASHHPWRNLSRCLDSHDYALDTMKSCRPGSVVQLIGDNQVFPVAYARHVLGLRPDLVPVEWEGTVFPRAVLRMREEPGMSRAQVEEELFRQNGELMYVPEERALVPGLSCRAEGLMYRVTTTAREKSLSAPPDLGRFFRRRTPHPRPPDREAEETVSHVPLVLARDAYRRGEPASARVHLAETVREGSHVPYSLVNASALYSLLGDDAEAEKCLRRLLAIQPNHVEARLNLGILCGKMGRYPEALKELDRALELSPNHPVAMQYRSRVLGLMQGSR